MKVPVGLKSSVGSPSVRGFIFIKGMTENFLYQGLENALGMRQAQREYSLVRVLYEDNFSSKS